MNTGRNARDNALDNENNQGESAWIYISGKYLLPAFAALAITYVGYVQHAIAVDSAAAMAHLGTENVALQKQVSELGNVLTEHRVQVTQLFSVIMSIQNKLEQLDARQRDTEQKLNIIIGRKNLTVPFTAVQ